MNSVEESIDQMLERSERLLIDLENVDKVRVLSGC